jgi:uncharacterized protein YndB with AHSA1/START domain
MQISKSIFVKRPVEAAFRHFTADVGRWWPLKEGFSFDRERAQEIVFEGRVGGRFFERYSDGEESLVGRVTAFEPPHRVAFTWRQPSWNADTFVEVRFAAEADGTRVTLEHAGFEALTGTPPKLYESYSDGWSLILTRFAA